LLGIKRLIPTPSVLIARTIAPVGINLMRAPGLSPSFLGAPPKKPPDIKSGAANNPIRSAQVIDSLNLELSRIS
jgi:hypothetical protein